jgi:phosphoglucosamine mutase
VANVPPMTAEMALEIGRATAYVCRQRNKNRRHKILIGRDTRVSGDMLECALTAGICSMGVDVLLVGTMPTPGIAFLVKNMRADAGMVISASHNPFQDNGIKLFSHDGFKLPDAEEDEIEELMKSGRIRDIRPTADEIGRVSRIDDAMGRYIVFCKNTFPGDLSLEGMKVVLDCANGATSRVAPVIFSELGAAVTTIHCQPDGTNINDRCGSQHTQDLAARVRELCADVGLAFDGDGDRLIAVDEHGQELTGDPIMLICAKMYKDRGWLANNLIIPTVMSNFGFLLALKELGIGHAAARVGDRYVLELMKEKGAVLGGEASGHVILLNHHTTGDGILAGLQLLGAMRFYRKPLSDLAGLMKMAPQKIINVDVKSKPSLDTIPEVQSAIATAERELGDKGRVLVRYSGTQCMCRVMVEGPTEEMTTRLAQTLAGTIRQHLG